MSNRVVALVVAGLVVAGVVVAVVLNRSGDTGPSTPETPGPTVTASPEPTPDTPSPDGTASPVDCSTIHPADQDVDFTEFTSGEENIALSYPEGWERFEIADEQILLFATPNGCDSLQLRAVELDSSAESFELETLRRFIEQELLPDSITQLGEPQVVERNGLRGWSYVYQFEDEQSGETGVHLHSYLFQGDTMYVLVLQALPQGAIQELEPIFTRIQRSLRLLDAPAPATPTPTPTG